MAKACVFVMQLPKDQYDEVTSPMQSHLNVGYGSEMTIAQLATTIAKVISYKGAIQFDATKPDRAPRKWMSSERLKELGWSASIHLEEGLTRAYADFSQTLNPSSSAS